MNSQELIQDKETNKNQNDQYTQWKHSADHTIAELNTELTNTSSSGILGQKKETKQEITHIFHQALLIANQQFVLLQNEMHHMQQQLKEYKTINFAELADSALKMFRSGLTKTINEYEKKIHDMEAFFASFKPRFNALGKKGAKLSYLDNKNKEISLLKENYDKISLLMEMQLEALKRIRIDTFHILQDRQNKHITTSVA